MNKLLSVIAAAGLAFSLAASVQAADAPAKPKTAQQEKMTTCNADAKSKALKGDERKTFMKQCLSAAGAPAAMEGKGVQQEKMKSCNADAKSKALKGAERKTFMKECLSGAPAA
ncbi:PsiF family protein [Ramlibacter sp. H39-3-26]|uniref:PsiF family protein n=1 Tax=Curvibacter soli TaxID=3031331 RepID=UPI0023DA2D00|nr:PsiF family protein [Ramlibacter sp. H39-3-26]MDF1486283.1 PsiF family protein [Ramlibacter sp. H39-3-26]